MNKEKIAKLNDELRKQIINNQWQKTHNMIVMSKGISEYDPMEQNAIFEKVAEYNDFSEDNNPFKERHFGDFEFNFVKMYWQIDYYDLNGEYHSEDKSNPDITKRVLTIMKADEY